MNTTGRQHTKEQVIKMNKKARRKLLAQEVLFYINAKRLFSFGNYFMEEDEKCYSCAVGASTAICKLSGIGNVLHDNAMIMFGFSPEQINLIEYLYEDTKTRSSEKYWRLMDYLRDFDRNTRLKVLWKMILDDPDHIPKPDAHLPYGVPYEDSHY